VVVEGRGEREGWGDAVGGKKGRGTTMTVADSPPPRPHPCQKKFRKIGCGSWGNLQKKTYRDVTYILHTISVVSQRTSLNDPRRAGGPAQAAKKTAGPLHQPHKIFSSKRGRRRKGVPELGRKLLAGLDPLAPPPSGGGAFAGT